MKWRRLPRAAQSASLSPAPWGRGKLLAALGCLIVALAFVIAGLGLVVHAAVTGVKGPGKEPEAASVVAGDQLARRDALATAPMLQVEPEESRSGIPTARVGDTLSVPHSTLIGPAKVPSGFPRTPEGAVAQLASIEVAVLSEMSVARTSEIHSSWSMPGSVPVEQWTLMNNVRSFLGAARMGPALDVGASVTVTPVAAQVKATDGPDWVVACVLVDVRAVVTSESRMAYGYCEPMQWDGQRWLIAPGAPAATAPSTWPGTELAITAGWRAWVRNGQ